MAKKKAPEGLFGEVEGGLTGAVRAVDEVPESVVKAYEAAQAQQGGSGITDVAGHVIPHEETVTTKPKGKAKGKGKAAKPTQAEINAEEAKAIAENPWTQAGDALANADIQETEAAEQAMSPAYSAQIAGQAQNQALADAGVSAGSGAGQWLQSNLAQANANDSPLMQAMNAYQAAYEKTQPAVASALQDMGQANALATSIAPENAYLNLLPSHLGNTSYLQLSPAEAQGLPPGLSYYLGQSGVSLPKSGTTAGIPSAGAILSGGTSPNPTPSVAPALTSGTGTAPS